MGNRIRTNTYDPKMDISGMTFGFMHVDFPVSESLNGVKMLYSCTDVSNGHSNLVYYGSDLFYYRRLSEKSWSQIEPGMRFGKWVTVERVTDNENLRVNEIWTCQKDSGEIADCSRHYLETYGLGKLQSTRLYNFEDLQGKLFGKLKAIRKAYFDDHNSIWRCECQCEHKSVVYRRIKDLKTLSNSKMSCFKCERDAKHIYEFDELPIYTIFKGMKQRCYNPRNPAYYRYGGRGIKICDEWLQNPKLFTEWALANGYYKGLTIERINVDGDYCPENCKWIPREMQSSNTSRNVLYTVNGITKTASEWSRLFGKNSGRLSYIGCRNGRDAAMKYISEHLRRMTKERYV